jgi:TolB-like protein/Tfp pilus assembly protein PilF
MNPRNFFAELKRRNVYKVAVAYAVMAWLLIQAASILFPTFEAPPWVMKVFVVLVAAGFVVALVIAWAFEMTPQGIKRTENVGADEVIPQWSGRKFAALIIVIAVGAAALLAYQLLRPKSPAPPTSEVSNTPQKSIAVLPFENLSEDKANAYFAEGIQDEILTRLSKIADLKVISRTSTLKYKSAPNNLREIAKQLGVANIVEGSVQKSADQVRITVQLINALNDSHLWAETYDRKLIDVFQVETDVAQKIASALAATLTGGEKNAINARGTDNPQAYETYLRAVALRTSAGQSAEALQHYIDFCRRAVELDPNFAQAWADLAAGESSKYFFPEHTSAQKERARVAAEKALSLAPDSADAQTAMGLYNYYCLRDFDRAIERFEAARKIAPNDWKVIGSMALVKRRQGKIDEAIALQKQAVDLDPLNEGVWSELAGSYIGKRDFAAALQASDRALEIAPNETGLLAGKAETYLSKGDVEAAWQIIKGVTISPGERSVGAYVTVLAFQRRFQDAIAFISSKLETDKERSPRFAAIDRASLGHLYLALGQRDQAQPFLLQAESELQQFQASDPSLLTTEVLMEVEALLGKKAEVEQMAKTLMEIVGPDQWQGPLDEELIARAYTKLGNFDRALPLLQHALNVPCVAPLTPAILRLDPDWDPIRKDPRFQKLANAKP